MSRKRRYTPDDEDARLDALAARKGLGSLAPETATKTAASERPEVKLTIVIPAAIGRALRRAAADQGVTMRYLVLAALRDAGYPVAEDELIEDRRSR